MHIQVTQYDINFGRKNNCKHCPIARAMTRAYGEPCKVYIDYCITPQGYKSLPDVATHFINDYDADKPVKPMEFDI